MAHAGPGVGGPGAGGPGIGPGIGPGMGVHGGGMHGGFGFHSGTAFGFAGRGAFSEGHSYQHSADDPRSKNQPAIRSSQRYHTTESSSPRPEPKPSQQPSAPTRPQPKSPPKPPKLHRGATEGASKYLAKKSVLRTALTLASLSLTLGITMCMSNILATKLWHLGPIHLDGGFILFPLTYVIGDILVELFYRKVANCITFLCCIVNYLAFLMLKFTVLLPPTPDVTQIEPGLALGVSVQIMSASALALIVSTITNNLIYDYLRRYETTHAVSKKAIKRRAWVSSFFAHIPDSLLFTFVAFGGMAKIPELLHQAATSYLAGILVETALLPLTGYIGFTLRQHLDKYLYSDAES